MAVSVIPYGSRLRAKLFESGNETIGAGDHKSVFISFSPAIPNIIGVCVVQTSNGSWVHSNIHTFDQNGAYVGCHNTFNDSITGKFSVIAFYE